MVKEDQHTIILIDLLQTYKFTRMSSTSNIRLEVVSITGEIRFVETHDLFFGPQGLLRVPGRLGCALDDVVCFKRKENALDPSNMGAPFSAMCEAFSNPDRVVSTVSALIGAGYVCSSEGDLHVWARIEGPVNADRGPRSGVTGSALRESSSTASRTHINPDVKNIMKQLCNKFCPRDDRGMMLSERGKGGLKRPAWVIESVLSGLRDEYDSSMLESARSKALNYMSRNAHSYSRLMLLPDDFKKDMRNVLAIKEFEKEATLWRQGPYGVLWAEEHITRLPTSKEISECAERITRRRTGTKEHR